MQTLQDFIRSRRLTRVEASDPARLTHPRWQAAYPPKEDAPLIGGRARLACKRFRVQRARLSRRLYSQAVNEALSEALALREAA